MESLDTVEDSEVGATLGASLETTLETSVGTSLIAATGASLEAILETSFGATLGASLGARLDSSTAAAANVESLEAVEDSEATDDSGTATEVDCETGSCGEAAGSEVGDISAPVAETVGEPSETGGNSVGGAAVSEAGDSEAREEI